LNTRHFDSFTFISVLFGESRFLASWCVGVRCDMACNDKDDHTGWVLGGRAIERSGGAGFLVGPQNQGRQFVSGLASKLFRRFSQVWPQNRWRQFSLVWPQNWWLGFPSLGLKTDSSSLVI
jgi:hypothetical protein